MPYDAPPHLAALSLEAIAEAVANRKLPRIEHWKPTETTNSGMRIAADGQWFHDGRPIGRRAMERAFASLLTRDAAGRHWLMTPQCRQSIAVEDAAFVAVDLARREQALIFRLNTDELVLAGPDHPLMARGDPETPAIYLSVRHGCEARIDRSTWLQLVDLADGALCVSSQGATFRLVPA